ncbi:fumarate hydratase C-terminal domain-containing protein [Vibrio lentus]|nr:fumarate hydratase C-terminal domain-containing protein [Vibrio lentus]
MGKRARIRRVNLDEITKEDVQEWKTGETVLLSGKILTGRDAAHKRIQSMLSESGGTRRCRPE